MLFASVFSGIGLVAIAAVAAGSFVVAQRAWRWSVVLVVTADALAWSWAGWLKSFGNVAYWGSAAGVGIALLLLARRSRVARVLLVLVAVVTAVLLASAGWSFEPHTTIRGAITFGSALAVVAFAAACSAAENGGRERLARALAVLAPAALALSLLLVVFDHRSAVAEGGGVSGFANGPNSLGLLLALSIGFLFAAPLVDCSTTWMVATVTVFAFAITLSANRTGMLATALAFAVYEIGMRRWRRLALGLAVAAVVGVVAVEWAPNVATFGRPLSVSTTTSGSQATPSQATPSQVKQLFGGRASDQSELSSLVGARDEAWREAGKLLARRPILGSGFATGGEIFAHYDVRSHFRYFVGAFYPNANVHDAYLQELLELGVAGGLLFILPALLSFVLVIAALRRGWQSPGEAAFGASAVVALVGAVFESLLAGFGAMTLLAWLSFAMLTVPVVSRRLALGPRGRGGELQSSAAVHA